MASIFPSRHKLATDLFPAATMRRRAPAAVVAIPARDEAARIESCLDALAAQRPPSGRHEPDLGIVVVANNCHDDTAARAAARLAASKLPHLVIELDLPEAHANAGFARGLAMDLAANWLETNPRPGILLTSDADTRVRPDWLARNKGAIASGCGAVAGRFDLDPLELAGFPEHMLSRQRLEAAYEAALLELAARLDPQPLDPWPNHATASGASFALTLAAYRQIGGLPQVATCEDRALASALARAGVPIRHDPGILVTTSARLDGRAQSGCASTLRERCARVEAPCDDLLEAFPAALRRIKLRAELRHAISRGTPAARWERALELAPGTLGSGTLKSFGETWARAEEASPLLTREPLCPSRIPANLAAARAALRALNRGSAKVHEVVAQQIEPIIVRPALVEHPQPWRAALDEEFGGRIP